MPDERGETRRQRNERLNIFVPPFHLPEHGQYLWDWFRQLSLVAGRISDGMYQPIPPSEYLAWQQITGNIVYSWEYDILFSMDAVYCEEMNKEIQSQRAIRMEQAKRDSKGVK